MRMMPVAAAAAAIGLSLILLGGLGVEFGTDIGSDDGKIEEEIAEEAGDENRTLDPEQGEDGGGFFSFVVGGLSQIRSLISFVLFLPGTLADLGLPSEAAATIGYAIQFILVIGIVQVALKWEVR